MVNIDDAVSYVETIKDIADSLKYAAPEMQDFWMKELDDAIEATLKLLKAQQ